MRIKSITQRLASLVMGVCCVSGTQLMGQESNKQTVEPVYRLSHNINVASLANNDSTAKASGDAAATNDAKPAQPAASTTATPHPLDKAIDIAETGLTNIQDNIRDYKAIMVKRERVNNVLLDAEYMAVKIRNRRETASGTVPFSVYMNFLKPTAKKGFECIWVEGKNNGKILAHATGIKGLITVRLDPLGSMAMDGNRYPIYEAGIENLVSKLLEKGTRDREAGLCEVRYVENTKINKRPCTMIQVVHTEQVAPYEFHKAQIFIDDELQIPVRYAAYLWPSAPGEDPPLLEEYTYVNVELNVGLTDKDFDHSNPAYNYR